MRLLIDECCTPALIAVAERQGHTAQLSVETIGLGPAASDAELFAFAQLIEATVVTVNRRDFVRIARTHGAHCGLVVVPSLTAARSIRLFAGHLARLDQVLTTAPGSMLVLSEADGVRTLVDR